ncbi:ABC transporter permease [Govanella unica]|uniref:FtsX-like permease family protein n=1 Tax=Govanella unica TaxID=2975056 RepID=A0A9X3Z656_9PROT|nr:FtsX-like permease family protein [Govania unica]MDA5192663.1 FtsX-like permease family protein [Govania unica]
MTARLPMVWRLALRDLWGGLNRFRVFAICLVLGVAAIAGVGSLTEAVVSGLRHEGRTLLGGDVEFRLSHRAATADERAFFAHGGRVSETQSMRAMLHLARNGTRNLSTVKAVDARYPLYGTLELTGGGSLAAALAERDGHWGAVIAPELAERMKARVGDRIMIGNLEVELRALIRREPDRANEGFELAPRLMIAAAALPQTGLLTEGSLVTHSYRVKMPDGAAIKPWVARLEAAFPDAGWRVTTSDSSAPRLREFAERLGQFLTLVGLTTLVVGGVGVAGAVRSYLDGKTETIATLKALGAESGLIARIYFSQILLITLLCLALGVVLGAMMPGLLSSVLADKLPVPPAGGIYVWALIKAALYGLLVVLAFTLGPVMRTRRVPAAALFRREPGDVRQDGEMWVRLVEVGLIAVLAILPFAGSDNRLFIFGFEAGAAVVLLLLLLTGWLVREGAARLPRPRHPVLRLALGNLHRPGAPTAGVVLALGLGLTLFATLTLVEGNLGRQIRDNLPTEAPAFFFLDLQRDQHDAFLRTAERIAGPDSVRAVPYMRGQITRIKNFPAEAAPIAPDARWALRGDRGLTFSATLPADNQLVAGHWWPMNYAGPPQISMESGLAEGMGVTLGDRLTINVLGREIEAEIVSLRKVDWGSMGINFAIIFDPATLRDAPYSYLATLTASKATEDRAYRALTDQFPNLSAVRMKEVLGDVSRIMADMANAVRAAAAITLAAGVLVLAGATAAGARARVYDAVILKVLGGTRWTVMAVLVLEYAILGALTGVLAAAFGSLAAWVLVTKVMAIQWVFLPGAVAVTILASVLVTILFGLLGTWRALTVRPAQALRAFAA